MHRRPRWPVSSPLAPKARSLVKAARGNRARIGSRGYAAFVKRSQRMNRWIALVSLVPAAALAAGPAELSGLNALYPALDELYQDLHRNPELSNHEEKTAAKMAARLHRLGFEVTERVGGHGVVGV